MVRGIYVVQVSTTLKRGRAKKVRLGEDAFLLVHEEASHLKLLVKDERSNPE
jgi:hypothetical protein